MPKKVYDEFIRALSRDVITNYSSGDKYLSVRGVSEKFSVSLQTAQKGISELRDSGLLRCKPNSGITVITSCEFMWANLDCAITPNGRMNITASSANFFSIILIFN